MKKPKLIDAHTHVQFAAYENDRETVIKRSLDNDIWLVNIGTQKDTSLKAVETADYYVEGVYATVGLHPIHTEKSYHDPQELGGGNATKAFMSREEEFDYDYYKKLLSHPKVLAIGECGLDYYRLGNGSKEKQKEAFKAQINLAYELGKPLMIHCREAFPDLIDILKANEAKKLKADPPGIIHFFSGTKGEAAALLDMGFYFSFGGVITFTSSYNEILKYISLEKILLETDAPYVAPVPFHGKRNEPSYVTYVAEAVAKIFDAPLEIVAKKTTRNTRRVLRME